MKCDDDFVDNDDNNDKDKNSEKDDNDDNNKEGKQVSRKLLVQSKKANIWTAGNLISIWNKVRVIGSNSGLEIRKLAPDQTNVSSKQINVLKVANHKFSGASIDSKTCSGLTSLHLACESGHVGVVTKLLDHNRFVYNPVSFLEMLWSSISYLLYALSLKDFIVFL